VIVFLIGLTDGPDFRIGPSSEDFNESLFIGASPLECQDQEDLNHSPDPHAETRGALAKKAPVQETTQEANAQTTKPSWIFSLPPDQRQHNQGGTCQLVKISRTSHENCFGPKIKKERI